MKKLLFLSTIALFVMVQVCLAAITVDTAPTPAGASGSNTVSKSLVVANNANRVLVGIDGSTVAEDATFAFNTTETLTVDPGAAIQGTFVSATAGYRIAPTATTANLTATHTGSPNQGVCGVVIDGADQSSPLRAVAETSTTGTAATSVTISGIVAGDIVVYGMFDRDAGGLDPGTWDMTTGSATGEVDMGTVGFSSQQIFGCGYVIATGTSANVGGTMSGSSANARVCLVAIAIKPSPSMDNDRRRRP
jgi:hypothetical protein